MTTLLSSLYVFHQTKGPAYITFAWSLPGSLLLVQAKQQHAHWSCRFMLAIYDKHNGGLGPECDQVYIITELHALWY